VPNVIANHFEQLAVPELLLAQRIRKVMRWRVRKTLREIILYYTHSNCADTRIIRNEIVFKMSRERNTLFIVPDANVHVLLLRARDI